MKITVTEEAKNDNDFKFLEMRMTMIILLYLAKEGKGPFCSEVSFPVGSPPMSDCKCWGQLDQDFNENHDNGGKHIDNDGKHNDHDDHDI